MRGNPCQTVHIAPASCLSVGLLICPNFTKHSPLSRHKEWPLEWGDEKTKTSTWWFGDDVHKMNTMSKQAKANNFILFYWSFPSFFHSPPPHRRGIHTTCWSRIDAKLPRQQHAQMRRDMQPTKWFYATRRDIRQHAQSRCDMQPTKLDHPIHVHF